MAKSLVVISDTHFGCQLALCPPTVKLDNGGTYHQSPLQEKLWSFWKEFWSTFVPQATRGEDFVLIHNGDVLDGVHHHASTQISHNLTDQKKISCDVLSKVISNPKCKAYYQIRGTEAHVGISGQEEESIAQELGAAKDQFGNYARWELWLEFGAQKSLVHFTHHVGTTSSAAYESTAVYKELIEAYTEAGRYKLQPPDCVVRSHRHRNFKIEVPSQGGKSAIAVITPGWQLKTPFSYRLTMGRSALPQIGGIVIREGEEVPIYVRSQVWPIDRPKTERV